MLGLRNVMIASWVFGASVTAVNAAPPRIAMTLPLGIPPGATTKVTLRGWDFDKATEVRVSEGRAAVKLVGQGNAAVPDKFDAKKVGDRQVEVEISAPAEPGSAVLALSVVTPEGVSEPREIWVGGELPVVAEKEPNNGLRQPQPVAIGQLVDGAIQNPLDTDVYAIEGTAGQRLSVEILAHRRGQALDATLTLFDDRLAILASNDDQTDTVDPRVELTLPMTGRFMIVVADAHDRGGPLNQYRLQIRHRP